MTSFPTDLFSSLSYHPENLGAIISRFQYVTSIPAPAICCLTLGL